MEAIPIKHLLTNPETGYLETLIQKFFSKMEKCEDDYDKIGLLKESFYYLKDKLYRSPLSSLTFEEYGEFVSKTYLEKFIPDFEMAAKEYEKQQRCTLRCGAVLLNDDETHVVAVKGFYCQDWFFPSGKLEKKDKNHAECASREVMEEIGLKFSFSKGKPMIVKGEAFDTYLYIYKGLDMKQQFKPEVCGEIEKIA